MSDNPIRVSDPRTPVTGTKTCHHGFNTCAACHYDYMEEHSRKLLQLNGDVRAWLREELRLCRGDPKRPAGELRMILDLHGVLPDFDPAVDGELENEVMRFLYA